MEKIMIYNTLTKQKEEFKPIEPGKIKMFVCGSTVYDDAHLGHAKTYIEFDVIVRWLRHIGYNVHYVQNITDVDDKIVERAKEKGTDAISLARFYEKRLFEDMEQLGVKKNVDNYPRSHDYIDAIRQQIQLLADKGYAYYLDGDVYYDVDKFADYTKLSGMKLEELTRHRIEPKEGKLHPYDFALWKATQPGEEPSWEISVKIGGKEIRLHGRPGWHIEDTAMTYSIFGPQYDIHGGANELIFPHHTNEIAQAEAAFGVKPFVRYWMHSGVLNVDGKKMSKSLHNFITIRDFLSSHEPELLRLIAISTHYSNELNYTEQLVSSSRNRLNYFYQSLGAFYSMPESEGDEPEPAELTQALLELERDFTGAMNDDFNTSLALSILAKAASTLKRFADSNRFISHAAKESIFAKFMSVADVFGILSKEKLVAPLSDEIRGLIKKREELRVEKKFTESDAIREKLKSMGIKLEDTEYGTVWYKIA
ncbi:MAG: cysteine--tRNA ligase [Candidatus Micrarchaeaceae archaeon]